MWWFFPIRGLYFSESEDQHDLDSPLLGQFTFVSKHQMTEQILPSLKLDDFGEGNEDGARKVFHEFERLAEFDSFLAVRFNLAPDADDSVFEATREKAYKRAREVSSLLSLLLLGLNDGPFTCGLIDVWRKQDSRISHFVYVDTHEENWHQGMSILSTLLVRCSKPATCISRKELKARLSKSNFQIIATPVLRDMKTVNTKLQSILRTAIVNVADSAIASSHDSQVLKAVNAMEAMFGKNFDEMQKRAKSLIGEKGFELYKGDDVFKARHNLVHAGVEVRPEIGVHAFQLSFDCVLQYAHLIRKLRNEDLLLSYLDLFDRASKIADNIWSPRQRIALNRLRLHSASATPFSFILKWMEFVNDEGANLTWESFLDQSGFAP